MATIVGLVFPEEAKKPSAKSGKDTAHKGKKKAEKGEEEK